MSTLKETVRRKGILIEMIRATQPTQTWKILIVDALSLRIMTSVCRMNDVLEENVTLIEDISRKRQAYPQQDAIYFITPTIQSVQAFIADYQNGKPYAAAHLYFTSALSDDVFATIKGSQALQYVKTLKELNVEYLALEQQAFILDMPDSFHCLYNSALSEKLNEDLIQMSKRMVSIVSSLGEYPAIRYYTHPKQKNSTKQLANYFQAEVDKFVENDDSISKENSNLVFVIVERSADVMAPLLHEFTYQAMMHDLLSFSDYGKYQAKLDATEPIDQKKTMATLDEYDAIWNLIRHWHYADAVEYIKETFSKFIGSNKAATAAMGGRDSPDGIEGINAMKDLLSSLPEFQEMRLKFSTHINICQECKEKFAKRQLDIVASVEQDLSTGETADGKKPRNIFLTVLPLLDDRDIPNTDKIRLLMLYIISQDGIHETDRKRLLEQAKLSPEESQGITNLSNLGVRLAPAVKKGETDDRGPYHYYGKTTSSHRKNKKSDAMNYDLSRYVPMMKFMMEDQVNDKLDQNYFPFIKESKLKTVKPAVPSSALVGSSNSNPWSLRTTRANWIKKTSGNGSPSKDSQNNEVVTSSAKSVEYRRNGPTIVLFVIGGMTYSEMRAAYEVMNDSQRDVIIGSTHVFTPIQFLEAVQGVHQNEVKRQDVKATSAALNTGIVDDKKADKKGAFVVFKKK